MKEFLPELRSQLARELKEHGLSQSQIAEELEITQAAVSKYLRRNEEQTPYSEKIVLLVSSMSKAILNDDVSSDKLVYMTCSTCMGLRIGSTICIQHQQQIPSLRDSSCKICSELLGGKDDEFANRARVLNDMALAISILGEIDGFDKVVPQVRANLVLAKEQAQTIDDVAGIPGRITAVNGRARILSSARFGASRHTADILLKMMNLSKDIRACICLSGSDYMSMATKELGILMTMINGDNDTSEAIMENAISAFDKQRISSPFAVHLTGAIGVEPIIYLFGTSASQLSNITKKIAYKVNL